MGCRIKAETWFERLLLVTQKSSGDAVPLQVGEGQVKARWWEAVQAEETRLTPRAGWLVVSCTGSGRNTRQGWGGACKRWVKIWWSSHKWCGHIGEALGWVEVVWGGHTDFEANRAVCVKMEINFTRRDNFHCLGLKKTSLTKFQTYKVSRLKMYILYLRDSPQKPFRWLFPVPLRV